MLNRQAYLKRVLYRLRQRYGLPLTYTRVDSATVDYEVGTRVPSETSYSIKKAIRLPRKLGRESNLMGTLGNFNYGGTYDKQVRRIIIEKSQLSIVPRNGTDYVTINSEKWNVVEVWELDDAIGYVILVESIESS